MELISSLMLARAQFAANITFHILFPTLSIALGWFLLFFKLRYNYTKDSKWIEAYKFYIKVFSLCFALGVVSGITMSFQFGTNWPGFMKTVGNVAGPLLAYEVLSAFFLEATFLGVMLFGFNRVSNRVHTIATLLVALGTTLSAFWIISLNSWMHTPSGFDIKDGVVIVSNWIEVVFNPSMLYRLTHMLMASAISTAFLIMGLSTYQWLKGDQRKSVIAVIKVATYTAAIIVPIQFIVGDMHGLNTLKYQPEKIAAMEGIWETEKSAPLRLFAIPDSKTRSNSYEIKVPHLGSLILTHNWDGEIKGLNEFQDIPPVAPIFFSFRIMVGIGFLMLATSWLSSYQLLRKDKLKRYLAYIIVAMTFSGWLATLAGWYTTEIGRQPWLVNGILKTADAVSDIKASMVLSTFIAYITVYIALITVFVLTLFYLARQDSKNTTKLSSLTTENDHEIILLKGGN